jgi:hypothetical protein
MLRTPGDLRSQRPPFGWNARAGPASYRRGRATPSARHFFATLRVYYFSVNTRVAARTLRCLPYDVAAYKAVWAES